VKPTKEQKVLFAVSAPAPDGVTVILLGIPAGAWEYMKGGKTHSFDLTKAGFPLRLALFGKETTDAVEQELREQLEIAGVEVEDRRGQDFSI